MARKVATRYLGLLIGVLLLVAVITSAGAGDRREFLIELDGTFARFVMDCTLIEGDIRETIQRREYLPEYYVIVAEAISCRVTMPHYSGRIWGTLYADGKPIANTEQNAVHPAIELRSEGPWGPARGIKLLEPAFRPGTPGRPAVPPGNPSIPPVNQSAPPENPSVPPVEPSVPPVNPWTPPPVQ